MIKSLTFRLRVFGQRLTLTSRHVFCWPLLVEVILITLPQRPKLTDRSLSSFTEMKIFVMFVLICNVCTFQVLWVVCPFIQFCCNVSPSLKINKIFIMKNSAIVIYCTSLNYILFFFPRSISHSVFNLILFFFIFLYLHIALGKCLLYLQLYISAIIII